jgi:hypothetical protein
MNHFDMLARHLSRREKVSFYPVGLTTVGSLEQVKRAILVHVSGGQN